MSLPKSLNDAALGRLQRSDDDYYLGKITLDGLTVELGVGLFEMTEDEFSSRLLRLRTVVEALLSDAEIFRLAVADRLLGLYNKTWRGDWPFMNEKQFAEMLDLLLISVEANAVTLTYDDDGLFRGHRVWLEISDKFEVIDAGI